MNATFGEIFKNAQPFTEQVGIMCGYLGNQNVMASFQRIGAILNKNIYIYSIISNVFKKMKYNNGLPPNLMKKEIEKVQVKVNRHFYSQTGHFYPSYEDISGFFFFKVGKSIFSDTLRHIIRSSFGNDVKTVK